MRILALDWGTVRIGAAVSDPTGKFAFPLEEPLSSKKVFDELPGLCAQLSVEKILIGLPQGLSGQESESTKAAMQFKEKISKLISIPIEMLDERFSSKSAEQALNSQGISAEKQRKIKDNVAAQIILQTYLDQNHNKN